MQGKDLYSQFDFSGNPYLQISNLWKERVFAQNSYPSMKPLSEQQDFSEELNGFFDRLANMSHLEPDCEPVQEEVKNLYLLFDRHFAHKYTLMAFAGLGRLYSTDARMVAELDQYGPGTAEFLGKAIAVYVSKRAA